MFDFSNENGLLWGLEGAKNAVGHYAVSLAGHDRGKIYLVVGPVREGEIAGELLLCDGKKRPIGHPKQKKRRHVTVLKERDEWLAARLLAGERVDDSVLIHSLKEFSRGRNGDFKEKEA